jgi:drug/metabolite transporter (DMT)-like permease
MLLEGEQRMQRSMGSLALAGAFILAGTSVIAARFVTAKLGVFTIASGSLFFALLGLLPVCAPRLGKTLRQMAASDWTMLVFQALCGIFLFRMFLLKGLALTSTAEAGILTGVTPAATSLLAWLILKEWLSGWRLAGLASTVTGILLIQGVSLSATGFLNGHFVGNLLVICAAMCESIFNILSRIGSVKTASDHLRTLDTVMQTTIVTGIALLLCLIPALGEAPVFSLMTLDTAGWLSLTWYGVFVTALAYILWYTGIKRLEASVAAAFSGMMPFTSLLLSVLILGERPGWAQWLGGVLVIIGMLLTGLKSPDQQKSS